MENFEQTSNPEFVQKDIIAEDLALNQQHVYATTSQRFFNLLIDNVLMRFGLSLVSGYAVGLLLGTLVPEFMYDISYGAPGWKLFALAYIIGVFNYLIYYTLCEKLFKGVTLGKLITGTKAIREDGQELTLRDAFLRSLSRLVPFEPFSGFSGHPWHDIWTDTIVVKTR